MEDIKRKSSKTTSSRAHPYKSKIAAAKQAAKDKLKGTIFVDALPPQEDEKVVVTSEHFKNMSKSDKDYGKMYLRCPQRNCDLFQWWRIIVTDVCWGKHVLAGKFDYKKRWVAECFYQ